MYRRNRKRDGMLVLTRYSGESITVGDNLKEPIEIKILEVIDSRVKVGIKAPTDVKIIRALDGIEAVEMAKNKSCNLILMDIQMPKMDGYRATREIKRMKGTLPVFPH